MAPSSSLYPPPEVCSLRAARTTSGALVAPARQCGQGLRGGPGTQQPVRAEQVECLAGWAQKVTAATGRGTSLARSLYSSSSALIANLYLPGGCER